tara:strand:- start:937 stop:1320 length:384 start_codon:yes stop_codon:yes gene_type:complete
MNLEIKTEKELALLMFGMTLSNTPELDFWHEQTTDHRAVFGDFDSICLIVNRDGSTWTDFHQPSSKVLSLALDGAYAEACRDAAQIFEVWRKAAEKEQRKADRKKKAEDKKALKAQATVVNLQEAQS